MKPTRLQAACQLLPCLFLPGGSSCPWSSPPAVCTAPGVNPNHLSSMGLLGSSRGRVLAGKQDSVVGEDLPGSSRRVSHRGSGFRAAGDKC